MFRALVVVVPALIGLCQGCAAQGPSKTVTAFVTMPDGSPARDAHVTLVPGRGVLTIADAKAIDDENSAGCRRLSVGKNGRIRFPRPSGPFRIVALHPTGYAESSGTWKADGHVGLQPWARLEGRLMVGDKPDAGKRISVWPGGHMRFNPYGPTVTHDLRATTDAEGRFAFPRVPPGRLVVARHVEWTFSGGPGGSGFTQHQRVDARPGETASVVLGGAGRAIVGDVYVPRELGSPDGLEFGICKVTPKLRLVVSSDVSAERPLPTMFPVEMNHVDGSFRVADVPAGEYEIYVEVRTTTRHPTRRAGDVVASGRFPFIVPGGRGGNGEPMRLPTIPLELHTPVPRVGDAAPDFVANRLEGGDLRLSDFRGRHVLLCFWATTSGDSLRSIAELDALHDEFGKDGRLVMIGLSTDLSRGAPLAYARQRPMPWQSCYIGPDSATATLYGVSRIPSIWLLGPDGSVVAKPLAGEGIRAAVVKAFQQSAGK